MKRIFTLTILMTAFVMNVAAWEPVIKERHWFGILEYEGTHTETDQESGNTWIADDYGENELHYSITYGENNQIQSIKGYYAWHQGEWGGAHPASTFNCWMDDTESDPKPRFRVNRTDIWVIGKNDNSDYNRGQGLKVNLNRDEGTCLWIQHLQANDKFIIEYYLDPNVEGNSNYAQAFLASQTGCAAVTNRTPTQYCHDDSKLESGTEYTCSEEGNVCVNFPGKTVIRCITIIYKNYKEATTNIRRFEETVGEESTPRVGYEMTITGSGVLEEKRGAVPYITMRYGAMGDMTYSKFLGTYGGAKRYGTASIVDESEELDPSKVQLQEQYRNHSEAANQKKLVGKEWTVFTENCDESDADDRFNSIYPLYGNYFYFFPEVNGRLKMRFYCEGVGEHMAFWYKQKGNEFITISAQPAPVSTTPNNLASNHDSNGDLYYEYVFDVEKDGVYYLCSNPTISTQQLPIPRLISYAFLPQFHLEPLWYVADDSQKASGAVDHAATLNQDFTVNGSHNIITEVKCLGNIHSAEPYFVADNANNKAYLNFRNIVYESQAQNDPTLNDGGVVIVTVECEQGKAKFVLTVPYSAEKSVMETDNNNHKQRVRDTDETRNLNGKEVKKWDFFSNLLNIGKSTDSSSQLYQEIHKADGLTADWLVTYVDIEKSEEPIFKSVYDMDGDNADMLVETEGLLFFAHSNKIGIYNDNNPYDEDNYPNFQDRYIGILDEGEFWIPGLTAGDRIVIKMGCYGGNANLNIENAKDANETSLSGVDYVIGGSHEDATDKSQPYGEYHFISTGGHFKLKVTDAKLLKIYSIVIYKNSVNPDKILSENIVSGSREVLYTDNDAANSKQFALSLHYSGVGEPLACLGTSQKTGSFASSSPTLSQSGNNFTMAATKSNFGTFRPRLAVKTIGSTYVTDYADYSVAQGYRETKSYPYTWDFTDLRQYVKNSSLIDSDGKENGATSGLEVWKANSLNVTPEDNDGVLFVSGSQLYAGTQMFPESAGIGIEHINNAASRNGKLSMTNDTNGGLAVNDDDAWGFVVPSVGPNYAVYVHTKTTGGTASTPQYALKAYNLDFTSTAIGGIPAGWSCTQENETHTSENTYNAGSRIFSGFEGYQGKALYWRVNDARSGLLPLTPGNYKLTFAMAAWKGTPSYKVEIFKDGESTALATSSNYDAFPNAEGNTTADISGAMRQELSFTISEATNYYVKFTSTSGGFTEFLLLECNIKTPKQSFTYAQADENGNGGYVYAMSLPSTASATGTDVELYFQGYEINKIAVSNYSKKVNKNGWASESRADVIDPELTSYMTGKNFNTFLVTDVDNKVTHVTMTRIPEDKLMPAATEGSMNACLIHNEANGAVDLFGENSGFHLFVPDMHDEGEGAAKSAIETSSSLLKAKLTAGKVEAFDGDYTNFIFSYRYYDLSESGYVISDKYHEGSQSFYRVARDGAESSGNQGYLPLLTSTVPPSEWKDPSRCIALMFDDESGQDATDVEAIHNVITDVNDVYYNMSGQKMNSKPTRHGLYIMNGKKMYVK